METNEPSEIKRIQFLCSPFQGKHWEEMKAKRRMIALIPTAGKTREKIVNSVSKIYLEKKESIDEVENLEQEDQTKPSIRPKVILIPFSVSAEDALAAIKKHLGIKGT